MSGWIKIHRSITDHWLYKEKRIFSRLEAWNDILLMVNYSEAKSLIKGKVYTIKRGESILSLDSWAKRWNWDKSKVRRFMNLLQSEKMIELKSDAITTHLIVCNYVSYQGDQHTDETQKKRKRNTKETHTTPIEEEEEKNKNNSNNNIEERKLKFADTLKPFLSIYGKEMLNDFYRYWSEPNKSGTKFKMELEKTWDLERRLEMWSRRDMQFKKETPTVKTPHFQNGININEIDYSNNGNK